MSQRRRVAPWQSWRWALILALIAGVFTALTIFVASNFIVVEVSFIFFRLTARLAWILLLVAALGFVIGFLADRLRH